jgi:hypothetical protein
MFAAKEALHSEVRSILKQVDKGNFEKDELSRKLKEALARTLEQERSIATWKLFALNGNKGQQNLPYYQDEEGTGTIGRV